MRDADKGLQYFVQRLCDPEDQRAVCQGRGGYGGVGALGLHECTVHWPNGRGLCEKELIPNTHE